MRKRQRTSYFDSFSQLSDIAISEAALLTSAFGDRATPGELVATLEAVLDLESDGDAVNHMIFERVGTDFMPPIEREDIIGLADALDDVLDAIEDVVRHLYIYGFCGFSDSALQLSRLVEESCFALRDGCKMLGLAVAHPRSLSAKRGLKERIVLINSLEEEADRVYLSAMRKLHAEGGGDLMHVRMLSGIYTRLEGCCNACERAADAMETILLKNS